MFSNQPRLEPFYLRYGSTQKYDARAGEGAPLRRGRRQVPYEYPGRW